MKRILCNQYFGYSVRAERLKKKPNNYWNEEKNIQKFINEVKDVYQIRTIDDWNEITWDKIKKMGGSGIIPKMSLVDLKVQAFPENKKYFIEKKRKPKGFWDNKANIVEFLENLKTKLNIQSNEDIKLISARKIIQHSGGSSLLRKHSIEELKSIMLKENEDTIHIEKRKQKPIGYWEIEGNITDFFNTMKRKLNISNDKEFLDLLSIKLIREHGGGSLLTKSSLYDLKSLIYPEIKFHKKLKKNKGYWNSDDNVQKFLIDVKNKYNFNHPLDWDQISAKNIIEMGGATLLSKFSLLDLKLMGCPEYKNVIDSNSLKYRKHNGFWDDRNNIIEFLSTVKQKFNLETIDDWNRISKKQICDAGGSGLLSKYNSIFDILCIAYPEQNWEQNLLLKRDKRSNQRLLFLQVKKLFPKEEVIEDYFHNALTRLSGWNVQFDVYVPGKQIAFEYHGEHHFNEIPAFGQLELYVNRDTEKKNLCKKSGISLFIVPHWWNFTKDSLQNLITQNQI